MEPMARFLLRSYCLVEWTVTITLSDSFDMEKFPTSASILVDKTGDQNLVTQALNENADRVWTIDLRYDRPGVYNVSVVIHNAVSTKTLTQKVSLYNSFCLL